GIQLKLGNKTGALGNYKRAIETDEQLAQKEPNSPQRKLNLAASYFGLGGAYNDVGEWNGSLDAVRQAVRIRGKRSCSDAHAWRTANLYATTYYRIGLTLTKAGQAKQARENLLRAYDIRANLSQVNPSNTGARAEVAEACAALGNVAAATADGGQAMEWY